MPLIRVSEGTSVSIESHRIDEQMIDVNLASIDESLNKNIIISHFSKISHFVFVAYIPRESYANVARSAIIRSVAALNSVESKLPSSKASTSASTIASP